MNPKYFWLNEVRATSRATFALAPDTSKCNIKKIPPILLLRGHADGLACSGPHQHEQNFLNIAL
jgi:hypothetical protein